MVKKTPDDYIAECMNYYNVENVSDLSIEQLKSYIFSKKLFSILERKIRLRFLDLKDNPDLFNNNYHKKNGSNDKDENSVNQRETSLASLNQKENLIYNKNTETSFVNYNDDNYQDKPKIEFRKDIYEKSLDIIDNNIRDNEKYYRTKKRFLKLKDVLKAIIKNFYYCDEDYMSFYELYNRLQTDFKIVSLNRNNLIKLLNDYFETHHVYDIRCEQAIQTFINKLEKESNTAIDVSYNVLTRIHAKYGIDEIYFLKRQVSISEDKISVLNEYNDIENINLLILESDENRNKLEKYVYAYLKAFEYFDCKPQYNAFTDTLSNINNYLIIVDNILNSLNEIVSNNINIKLKALFDNPLVEKLNEKGISTVYDLKERLTYSCFAELLPDLHVIEQTIVTLTKNMDQDFISYVFRHVNERAITILKNRAEGKTLNEIGEKLQITRERVRQIETKGYEQIEKNLKEAFDDNTKLQLLFDDLYCVTYEKLAETFPKNYSVLIYLLKTIYPHNVLEGYCINFTESDWLATTKEFLKNLPNVLNKDMLKDKVQHLRNNLSDIEVELTEDFIKKLILNEYAHTYKYFFSKHKLTLRYKYNLILKRYFKNGVKITSEKGLDDFRNAYAKDFGHQIYKKSDRSIISVVSEIGFQIKRGTYGPMEQVEFNNEALFSKMTDYIKNSDVPVTYRGMYNRFKKELNDSGIYDFAQLHALFKIRLSEEEGYHLKRDSVNFGKESLSSVDSVVEYLKSIEEGISFEKLLENFPTYSKVQLQNIVNAHNELTTLNNNAIAVSNLKISDKEFEEIRVFIESHLKNNHYMDYRDLYTSFYLSKPNIYDKLQIEDGRGFYHIIHGLFNQFFQFSYPYIANTGIEIPDKNQQAYDFIKSRKDIDLEVFKEFLEDNYIRITNMKEFLESFYPEYIRVNTKRLIKTELLSISNESLQKIKVSIQTLFLSGSSYDLKEFPSYDYMPDIGYGWNMHLFASVIKLYFDGISLEYTSSNYDKGTIIIHKTNQPIEVKNNE